MICKSPSSSWDDVGDERLTNTRLQAENWTWITRLPTGTCMEGGRSWLGLGGSGISVTSSGILAQRGFLIHANWYAREGGAEQGHQDSRSTCLAMSFQYMFHFINLHLKFLELDPQPSSSVS